MIPEEETAVKALIAQLATCHESFRYAGFLNGFRGLMSTLLIF
jgi:hypothetical protein